MFLDHQNTLPTSGKRVYGHFRASGFLKRPKSDSLLDVARKPHTAEKAILQSIASSVREAVMINYGTLLRDHVTLRCRSIDRIFLQAYVPRLQTVGEVCTFLRWQRKFPIPSSAAFGRIGDEYVRALYRFAEANAIPLFTSRRAKTKKK